MPFPLASARVDPSSSTSTLTDAIPLSYKPDVPGQCERDLEKELELEKLGEKLDAPELLEKSVGIDGNPLGLATGDPEGVIWVEWEPNDPENPMNWNSRRKWVTTVVVCLMTLCVSLNGASFATGNEGMMRDFNCGTEMVALALSTYALGFAVAPLVLAPFSEEYGRYAVYVISGTLYVVFLFPIAFAKNITTVWVGRLLAGCAASTGATLVGGTLADLFDNAHRGPAMTLFSFSAFSGTGLGPSSMGYVAQVLGWRWVQYFQIIQSGLVILCLALFTRETRGSVLLSRRAKKLRKLHNDTRYQCRSDATRASLSVLIKVSLTRPLYILFTEPIVLAFSLWTGFAWGFLFLAVEAVGLIFSNVYGFSIGECGLVFLAVFVAGIFGTLTNTYQERLYQKHVATRGPEARLYASCIGGPLFGIGLLIVAFAQGRGHWIGPVIGLGIAFFGVFHLYLAAFNYTADTYSIYASSAISGLSIVRNSSSGFYPLFTFQLFDRLGYTWGTFLAGALALVFAIIPFVLLKFGARIRKASKIAQQLEKLRLEAEEEQQSREHADTKIVV